MRSIVSDAAIDVDREGDKTSLDVEPNKANLEE